VGHHDAENGTGQQRRIGQRQRQHDQGATAGMALQKHLSEGMEQRVKRNGNTHR